jgi:hypothetical protein
VHLFAPVCAAQVEGQPVQRPAVIAYLNSAYQHVLGEPFKQASALQQPSSDGVAAHKTKRRRQNDIQQPDELEQQEQAPAQAAAGVTTFAAMTQLLLFADAVGSTAPLLRACAAGIDKLCLHVQLPTGPPLDLSIKTPYYTGPIVDSSSLALGMVTEQQSSIAVAKFSAADAPAVKLALVQQVQAQTEALLYAAYKLQLSDVAEAVQKFVSMQTCFSGSVLRNAMRPVLSRRVMDAAAGYRSLHETLLLNHLVTQPCSLTGATVAPAIMVPTALPAEQQQPLKFTAELVQDVFGSSKGKQVPVEVDLFTSNVILGDHSHAAQVVLGPMKFSEDAKQVMLGPPAPAAG